LQRGQRTKIVSPCVKKCQLQEGVCLGCGRTQEQLRMWTTYTDRQRKEIMKELTCGPTETQATDTTRKDKA